MPILLACLLWPANASRPARGLAGAAGALGEAIEKLSAASNPTLAKADRWLTSLPLAPCNEVELGPVLAAMIVHDKPETWFGAAARQHPKDPRVA